MIANAPLERPDPIRLFIASPGDVQPERAACLRVIAQLNRRYEGRLRLEPVVWEEQFYHASADFQEQINQRTPPWDCALVVCLLWSKLGSPLKPGWPTRPDGTPFESGTVLEFEFTAPHARDKPIPDLYLFRKLDPPPVGQGTAAALTAARDAKAMVERFIDRWFYGAPVQPAPGLPEIRPFTAGLNDFLGTDAFEAMFARFLPWWLAGKGWLEQPVTWDIATRGLPYVGLLPFGPEHAEVFFGRDQARRSCRRLLEDADAAGFPYLLIQGDSGVGKSSLARSGLVHDIAVDTTAEHWASVVLLAGPDPLGRLAEALVAHPGLGAALTAPGSPFRTPEALARALAASPAVARDVLAGALDSLAEAARAAMKRETAPRTRLLLVLDQAEALLEATSAEQAALVGALVALVASGRVWLVATLRTDRLAAMARAPTLAPLVSREVRLAPEEAPALRGAAYTLAPPTPDALRDIVLRPAAEAGLGFEERAADGAGLAEEILSRLDGQRDALPLVQHALAQLFAGGRRVARWEDYAAMGGLDGAIAAHADATLGALDAAARAELWPLLRLLVAAPGASGQAATVPRPRDEFATTEARAALVDALVAARLLVLDGRRAMRLAHDALLRSWEMARQILEEKRDYLDLRGRLLGPCEEWRERGGPLLPASTLLTSATGILPLLADEPAALRLAAFVAASDAAAAAQARRVRRVNMGIATLAAVAVGVAGVAVWQWSEAQEGRRQAEQNFQAAEGAAGALVFDLARGLRERIGMPVEMVGEILRRAESALERIQHIAPDDPRLLRLRASANIEVSITLEQANDLAGAARAAENARALFGELLVAYPGFAQSHIDMAVSLLRVGEVRMAQGNLAGALEVFNAARWMLERLATADQGNRQAQSGLASSLARISAVREAQGNLSGALEAAEMALAIDKRLAETAVGSLQAQYNLAGSHQRIGDLLVAQNNLTEAIKAFESCLSITQRLADPNPGNAMAWVRGHGAHALDLA